MEWIVLIGIPLIACIGSVALWRRRARTVTPTQHTVRCPVNGKLASVSVRSDLDAAPSVRHLDVAACSLQPVTSFVPPERVAYFADVCPPQSYVVEVPSGPVHSASVSCSKACLSVLNAAEAGPNAGAVRCTSGMNDGMELVRRTQSPSITRIMWHHGN